MTDIYKDFTFEEAAGRFSTKESFVKHYGKEEQKVDRKNKDMVGLSGDIYRHGTDITEEEYLAK